MSLRILASASAAVAAAFRGQNRFSQTSGTLAVHSHPVSFLRFCSSPKSNILCFQIASTSLYVCERQCEGFINPPHRALRALVRLRKLRNILRRRGAIENKSIAIACDLAVAVLLCVSVSVATRPLRRGLTLPSRSDPAIRIRNSQSTARSALRNLVSNPPIRCL